MEIIKVTGKTLDEAIQSAKSSLDCSLDQIDYKVLEEGTRGI